MRGLLVLGVVVVMAGATGVAVLLLRSPPAPPETSALTTTEHAIPIVEPKIRPDAPVKLPAGVEIRFRETTKDAGIDFVHFDGRTEAEYIMDQTGAGLAWLDYDQDGLMDLFFVQGYTFQSPFPK